MFEHKQNNLPKKKETTISYMGRKKNESGEGGTMKVEKGEKWKMRRKKKSGEGSKFMRKSVQCI